MGWRELFAQWNTKTLGGSTKLGVSDYELITDGVHVEVDNLAALEAKNTVGQATNLQSQSGPIANSGSVIESLDTTGSGSPKVTLLEPGIGQAYEITAAEWKTKNANAGYWRLEAPDGSEVLVEYKAAVGSLDITTVPLRVVYPQKFTVTYGSATGDNQTNLAYHRIR